MTWTYTVGGDTTLDSLRLEIGDTNADEQQFADEELNDGIDEETTVVASAARVFELLANRHARDFDFSADGASFHKGSLVEHYRKLASYYRAKASGTESTQITPVDGHSDDVKADEVSLVRSRRLHTYW